MTKKQRLKALTNYSVAIHNFGNAVHVLAFVQSELQNIGLSSCLMVIVICCCCCFL